MLGKAAARGIEGLHDLIWVLNNEANQVKEKNDLIAGPLERSKGLFWIIG
jgi:hypothetical protein